MPKKIHIKLNGRKYKKGPNKIDDEDIPTLEQIQNYVKYLKQKVFDNFILDILLRSPHLTLPF
jgi:hypothetical protein